MSPAKSLTPGKAGEAGKAGKAGKPGKAMTPAAAPKMAAGQAQARARTLRASTRKLGLAAAMIRGLEVDRALRALNFCRRRAAGEVSKVLESAVANAENNHQLDIDRLYVSRVEVGKALTLKRWRARARGRVAPYRRFFSQLLVVVSEREEAGDGAKN